MSTWNAADEPTDPDPTVLVPQVPTTRDRGEWIEEHGPLVFLDAIAIVGCAVVLAKAFGVL